MHVIDHPLVQHHLTRLRDETTPPAEFRSIIDRLSGLLAYEATRDLALRPTSVKTPLVETTANVLRDRIGIIPILRAGLGMVDSILHMIPSAELWHLGFFRDEETHKPVLYYNKLPQAEPVDVAIIVDPMLATGGSAVAAIEAMKKWGVTTIKMAAILAAPEGVDRVVRLHPDVDLYACAVDEKLNDQAYIVPGLGDAGDRICNTQRRDHQ